MADADCLAWLEIGWLEQLDCHIERGHADDAGFSAAGLR